MHIIYPCHMSCTLEWRLIIDGYVYMYMPTCTFGCLLQDVITQTTGACIMACMLYCTLYVYCTYNSPVYTGAYKAALLVMLQLRLRTHMYACRCKPCGVWRGEPPYGSFLSYGCSKVAMYVVHIRVCAGVDYNLFISANDHMYACTEH